jgi:acetoacetate decarboxylase
LATARLQLEEKIADPAKVFNRPTVMRRYFPQLSGRESKEAAGR